MKPIELSEELNCSLQNALEIIQCAKASQAVSADSIAAVDEAGVATCVAASSCRSSSDNDNSNRNSGSANTSSSTSASSHTSARDLFAKAAGSSPIITFCKTLDRILGGGVPIGQITEFCGVPGVGKTQLGIQLALNAQIPLCFNGKGGEAVYIDTEGSFMVERCQEMAAEISKHLMKIAKQQQGRVAKQQQQQSGSVDPMLVTASEDMMLSAIETTPEKLLEGVNVYRAHDQSEVISIINLLPAFLKQRPKVRIIVIDSIAFHFRQDLNDTANRSRVLSSLAQNLNKIAHEFDVAIVVVNHVTTKFLSRQLSAGGGNAHSAASAVGGSTASTSSDSLQDAQRLVPALGEQWSHCVTNRVMLHWRGGTVRQATLVKSPFLPSATADYRVCERGIRDVSATVNANSNNAQKQSQPSESMPEQAAKRMRPSGGN